MYLKEANLHALGVGAAALQIFQQFIALRVRGIACVGNKPVAQNVITHFAFDELHGGA